MSDEKKKEEVHVRVEPVLDELKAASTACLAAQTARDRAIEELYAERRRANELQEKLHQAVVKETFWDRVNWYRALRLGLPPATMALGVVGGFAAWLMVYAGLLPADVATVIGACGIVAFVLGGVGAVAVLCE